MSEHRQTLHFSVQGELITRVAREKFFYMNQPVQAVEMLMDCMVTDEISEGDRLKAALDILQGKAQLIGTYPEPDYRLEYLETPDTRFDMKAHFEKQQAKYDKLQKDYNTLLSKLQCVLDEWEPSQYAQAACNRRWKEYGESGQIFDTPLQIQTSPFENTLVDDFISRMSRDEAVTGPEYGWLEPDGTFHAVDFGDHFKWAWDKARELTGQRYLSSDQADQTLFNLGWVLLHNPTMGTGHVQQGPDHLLTPEQREFLADYYMKRDKIEEAQKYLD